MGQVRAHAARAQASTSTGSPLRAARHGGEVTVILARPSDSRLSRHGVVRCGSSPYRCVRPKGTVLQSPFGEDVGTSNSVLGVVTESPMRVSSGSMSARGASCDVLGETR
jgi:hypothetical protein